MFTNEEKESMLQPWIAWPTPERATEFEQWEHWKPLELSLSDLATADKILTYLRAILGTRWDTVRGDESVVCRPVITGFTITGDENGWRLVTKGVWCIEKRR